MIQSLSTRAQAAYGAAAAPTRTPQGTEYAVFARITRRIKDAADSGPEGFPRLAEALYDNNRLWSTLAVDVAGEGNRLPREVRAQILSLAAFTNRHTTSVLRREADVRPLIDINVAIMKGLVGQTASDAAPSGAGARQGVAP